MKRIWTLQNAYSTLVNRSTLRDAILLPSNRLAASLVTTGSLNHSRTQSITSIRSLHQQLPRIQSDVRIE
jgi:hypothetical protein